MPVIYIYIFIYDYHDTHHRILIRTIRAVTLLTVINCIIISVCGHFITIMAVTGNTDGNWERSSITSHSDPVHSQNSLENKFG